MSKPVLHFQIPEWYHDMMRRPHGHKDALRQLAVLLKNKYGDEYNIIFSPLVLQSTSNKTTNITLNDTVDVNEFIKSLTDGSESEDYPADGNSVTMSICNIIGDEKSYIKKQKLLREGGVKDIINHVKVTKAPILILLVRPEGDKFKVFDTLMVNLDDKMNDIIKLLITSHNNLIENPEFIGNVGNYNRIYTREEILGK